MNKSINLVPIVLIFLLANCANSQSDKNGQSTKLAIDVEYFLKRSKEFNISDAKKLKSNNSTRLDIYRNSCNFNYEKDSTVEIQDYIFYFTDKSNSQVQVIIFPSTDYANLIAHRIEPYIMSVRNFKNIDENKRFCIGYYLSRIYNLLVKGNRLYLFGYDAVNASSENITEDKLKNLDSICKALNNL